MITFIKLYWYTEQSLTRKNNYKSWNICYECEDLYAYCRSARLPAAIFINISQIYLLVIVTSIQYKYKCGIQKINQNRLTYTIIVLPTNSLVSFDQPKFCLRYSLFLYYSHSSITFRDKKKCRFFLVHKQMQSFHWLEGLHLHSDWCNCWIYIYSSPRWV